MNSTKATAETLLKNLQADLWVWMQDAYDRMIRGPGWSMEALNMRDSILEIVQIVGPTPWDEINIRTLRNGVYLEVLKHGGFELPQIDWKRISDIESRVSTG